MSRAPTDPRSNDSGPDARAKPEPETLRDAGSTPAVPDPDVLLDLVHMRMPFGRFKGRRMIDLPEPYVVWFRQQGFPRGRIGELLGLLYEIKANGLEQLLEPLKKFPRRR